MRQALLQPPLKGDLAYMHAVLQILIKFKVPPLCSKVSLPLVLGRHVSTGVAMRHEFAPEGANNLWIHDAPVASMAISNINNEDAVRWMVQLTGNRA